MKNLSFDPTVTPVPSQPLPGDTARDIEYLHPSLPLNFIKGPVTHQHPRKTGSQALPDVSPVFYLMPNHLHKALLTGRAQRAPSSTAAVFSNA